MHYVYGTYSLVEMYLYQNIIISEISHFSNHTCYLHIVYCFYSVNLFIVYHLCFPNTVTASWREPILGWVDNLNGPTGLLAGAGKGVLRTLLCHKDLIADLVPVDICINLLISAAWYTAINR